MLGHDLPARFGGPKGRRSRSRGGRPGTARRLSAWTERLEGRLLLATGDPIISEFLASNSGGLADQDGDHPDWIEIYNPTAAAVDLAGWSLTDDPDVLGKWRFPAATIDPSGFLIVFASGKNRATAGAELHTNFKLGAAGDYLALGRPDGTVAQEFTPKYPPQANNVSYGVGFDASVLVAPGAQAEVKVPVDGTLEGAWQAPSFSPDGSWGRGPTGVGYGILQPGFNVHYVKANVGVDSIAKAEQVLGTPSLQSESINTSADTINYLNTGAGGNFSGDQPFPTQAINVDVDDFALDATGLVTIPTAGMWSFGVNSDDGFKLTLERNGQVLTSSFDGLRGAGDTIQVFNVPEPGQWNLHLEFFEHGGGSEVELFAAPGSHPAFDGGAFRLVGDRAGGGLAVGSVLADDPGQSSLVGRFVADDLNGLADGASIHSWTDRDPDGNGAIAAGAGGSPRLIKGTLGGHSAVRFDPADGGDQLRIAAAANPLSGAGDFSAAVVFRTSSPGIGPAGDWWANAGLVDADQAGTTEDWGLAFDAAGQVAAGIGNPDVSSYSRAGLADGQAHLAVIVRSAGVLSVYVDGRLQEQREDASTLPRNVADLVFGSLQTDRGYFAGDIAEVRLYNNDLTSSQVQRLATELDATYGLPGVTPSAVGTDLRGAMQGVNATAYVRIPFDAPDPSQFDSLSLRMEYDDGFVAYLNGVEVARRNAPASLSYNSAATAARGGDPTAVETFNLSADLGLLHVGTNVLAIRGLNASAADDDFLILPELIGSKLHADQLRYFATPTPGGPNADPYLGLVEPVAASVPRGFFAAPFAVALSVPTPGAEIRYTLDGSEPTATHGAIYAGPLTVSATTTLRSGAFEAGFLASPTVAETYLFLDDVIHQSPDGSPPPGWPSSWGNNNVDYGMDPDIVNSPIYGPELEAALKAIPTLSLTTDLGNLFDPSTGIYANAYQQGDDWERPASVELINPDGSKGFQIDAGLRIRGGYSRSGGNPKHAFRLFFRGEYGASGLDFPLFGTEGTDSFAKVDLRTAENYSWSFAGDPNNNFVAELFSRETMRDMGQPYTRSRFYQLYIDGEYWGLYQTEERPDANYAASYFGGDKGNYDVIKVETGPYTTQATDGNFDAWNRLWQDVTDPSVNLASDAAYQKLQGKNPDGSDNPADEALVDVDNLIDYMIVILYGGNLDAPISNFLGNNGPNNFFAIRDRTGRSGFKFFIHDAEHTLLDVNENRNGPYPAGQNFPQFNPQYLHQQLMANAGYRLRFADHVQKAFAPGGVLSPEVAAARFQAEADQIRMAIIGESARWGDAQRPNSPLTQADWRNAVDRVLTQVLPFRTAVVLDQFRANGLYPAFDAPAFLVNGAASRGGVVNLGDLLTLTAPSGTIYYTTDGTDPRLPNGAVSPSASAYPAGATITLARTSTVSARAYSNGSWSAVDAAKFNINVPAAAGNLAITEFDYHPHAPDLTKGELNVDRELFEFVEMQNVGAREINLAGLKFTSGISFDFAVATITTLAPGAYVLIVKNPAAFASRYGTGLPVAGTYGGAAGGLASLSNSGERLLLVDASGAAIEDFTYGTKAPWPTTPDGKGPSLVRIDPHAPGTAAANWRPSGNVGGSPGNPDTSPPTITPIAPRTIAEDADTGPLALTVGDAETAADALLVTVTSDNPVLLPAGTLVLAGTGADRTLRATPSRDGYGSATITVAVADADGAVALTSFLLIVTPVDDPPVAAPDSYTTDEDTPLSVPAASGVLLNDADIEGDRLVAVLDSGPAHGKLVLKQDGSFIYTPAANSNGVDGFTYHPNDGALDGASVAVAFQVKPVADPPTLGPIGDKSVDELTTLRLAIAATDPDSPPRTLTYRLDPGAPIGAAIDPATGAFTWTPTEAQGPGSYPITIRVTDNGTPALSATTTFPVKVNEVNAPPTLAAIADRAVDELKPLSFRASATDADLPAQSLMYRLDPGAPAGAAIDPVTGVFAWTPTEAQGPGTYTITVSVTDAGTPALSASRTFHARVDEVNRPPALPALADRSVDEQATLSFPIVATDADLPAQVLVYSLAPGAPAGASIGRTTGRFSWTPDETRGGGAYPITVIVGDGGTPALTDRRTFTVRVAEVNRPPVLPPVAPATLRGGETLTVVASATDADLPAQALTYALVPGAPTGAAIDPATGVIRWTAPAAQAPGIYGFTVRATDSGSPRLSADRSFVVTVAAPIPPTVVLGAPASLFAGAEFARTGRFDAAGPGPWKATVDYGDGSRGIPLAIAADDTFLFDHVYASPGTYAAVVRVRGASGAEGSATLVVQVAPVPAVTIAPGGVSKGKKGVAAIGLIFSDNVDSTGAGDRTRYRLVSAGRDKKFGTRDDQVIKLASATYDPGRHAVTITTKVPLPAAIKQFRLSISSGALRDTLGRPLDGDRDGQPGGDFFALLGKKTLTVAGVSRARPLPIRKGVPASFFRRGH